VGKMGFILYKNENVGIDVQKVEWIIIKSLNFKTAGYS